MPERTFSVATQGQSLKELASIAQKSSIQKRVVFEARLIVSGCPARDDECEIAAIFEAVKHGNPRSKALKRGIRYVNDPVYSDLFVAPERLLEMAEQGANSADCDEHAALIVSLLSAVGYSAGLRAWGESGKDFTHVYAVVAYPKHSDNQRALGLDSTVPESTVGWEPPGGHVSTAWILG